MGDNKDAYWTPLIDQNSTIGARRLPTKEAIRLGGRFALPILTKKRFFCVFSETRPTSESRVIRSQQR